VTRDPMNGGTVWYVSGGAVGVVTVVTVDSLC
jgi:hypothetical protein